MINRIGKFSAHTFDNQDQNRQSTPNLFTQKMPLFSTWNGVLILPDKKTELGGAINHSNDFIEAQVHCNFQDHRLHTNVISLPLSMLSVG